jgi:hypothetical protein
MNGRQQNVPSPIWSVKELAPAPVHFFDRSGKCEAVLRVQRSLPVLGAMPCPSRTDADFDLFGMKRPIWTI